HSRCADSALSTAVFNKRMLHSVQFVAVGDTFDCSDLSSFNLGHRHQTTVNDFSVEYDSARSAFPFATTFFGSGQLKLFAQHIQEARHGKDVDALPLVVYGEE